VVRTRTEKKRKEKKRKEKKRKEKKGKEKKKEKKRKRKEKKTKRKEKTRNEKKRKETKRKEKKRKEKRYRLPYSDGFNHLNRTAPVLIRTPKLTRFERAQFWGGGPEIGGPPNQKLGTTRNSVVLNTKVRADDYEL
jgi:hypothetical protein